MRQRQITEQPTNDLRAPGRVAPGAENRFDVSEERPKGYSEIARESVPLPDSSYRPTTSEEEFAGEQTGLRVVSAWPDDRSPSEDAVREVLAEEPQLDVSDLRLVIQGSTIAIEGSVASSRDRRELVTLLEKVPGISEVIATTLRIRSV